MKEKYQVEFDPAFTPQVVIEEASRCLLCYDAPCSHDCPADTKPDAFIRSVFFRNFKGAAEIVRENNALGGVCARVCPTEKLCQAGCSRSGIDRPIDIGRIQRYITDFESAAGMKILKAGSKKRGKVAVVGSGPAGLQASVTLTALGYEVTVYEKAPELGGWLRHGIPEYRLPNSIVDQEIKRIKEMGVAFVTGIEVGKEISLAKLKEKNKAILLAVGASYGRTLPLFDNNPVVEIAGDFLERTKSAQGNIDIPKSVIVIGGGDVAMDAATTLKALGCESVVCVAREELSYFPASHHELDTARAMNVSVIDGFTPISVKNNTVVFEHVALKSQLEITAEKIILAIGQYSKLESFTTIKNERGIVETTHYQTSDPHIFAAGDIVKGDKTVVYAVKTGKEAAQAIHQYVEGGCAC